MIKRSLECGGQRVSLNRREMLRLGAMGAAGALISSSASSQMVPGLLLPQNPAAAAPNPLNPAATQSLVPSAPGGIDPQLFAKAKAALDSHKIWARDSIGIVDFSKPSNEERFYVVDLAR